MIQFARENPRMPAAKPPIPAPGQAPNFHAWSRGGKKKSCGRRKKRRPSKRKSSGPCENLIWRERSATNSESEKLTPKLNKPKQNTVIAVITIVVVGT